MSTRYLLIIFVICASIFGGCTGFWNKVEGGELEMNKERTEIQHPDQGRNTTTIIIEPKNN